MGAAKRLLAQNKPNAVRILQAINSASDQALRGGEILRKLRAFVTRGVLSCQAESIALLIEDICLMTLLGAREHGISIQQSIEQNLPPVMAVRIHIQQVLFNLIRNAIEAMGNTEVKELAIRAALEDSFVVSTVSDTGCGIPTKVADELFQPFVSGTSSGMGIGLSFCRTIVEAHGGRLWTFPNPGGGTVFSFSLPIAAQNRVVNDVGAMPVARHTVQVPPTLALVSSENSLASV